MQNLSKKWWGSLREATSYNIPPMIEFPQGVPMKPTFLSPRQRFSPESIVEEKTCLGKTFPIKKKKIATMKMMIACGFCSVGAGVVVVVVGMVR